MLGADAMLFACSDLIRVLRSASSQGAGKSVRPVCSDNICCERNPRGYGLIIMCICARYR